MRRFMLDTNILLGLTRKAPWARWAYDEFDLGDPAAISFTSVVCIGEMLAIAEKRRWGSRKKMELERVLRDFPALPVQDTAILRAYALIDAWTQGTPVESPTGTAPPKPAVPMSKNDLWIAATTHVSGATLLSTDKDFGHLDGVWFRYEFVDQKAAPS